MQPKKLVLALGLYTVLIGALAVQPARAAALGPECPDIFGFPGTCVDQDPAGRCAAYAASMYPECPGMTIHCSSCTEGNGFDCRTDPIQCQN
jgi:hypothetical protein